MNKLVYPPIHRNNDNKNDNNYKEDNDNKDDNNNNSYCCESNFQNYFYLKL